LAAVIISLVLSKEKISKTKCAKIIYGSSSHLRAAKLNGSTVSQKLSNIWSLNSADMATLRHPGLGMILSQKSSKVMVT